MRIYKADSNGDPDDIVAALIASLELDSGKKVNHVEVKNKDEKEKEIKALIFFDDEKILDADIFIENIEGKMAFRVRGNYIQI